MLSPRIRKKTKRSTLSISIQHCAGGSSQGIRTIRKGNEINDIHIRKEEVKLSLLEDDTILYVENPKKYTRKLLEWINMSSKVAGYKNIRKINYISIH